MNKEKLIQELKDGKEIILQGEFTDNNDTWNYEYWKMIEDKFQCSYDGEYSHWFKEENLEFSFCPEEAEMIEIR